MVCYLFIYIYKLLNNEVLLVQKIQTKYITVIKQQDEMWDYFMI